MIRLALLGLFCFIVAAYSVKDWYKSLCASIVLMAVLEHPDMPKTLFGVQGLNPWNLVFLVIALAWLAARHREGLKWDMPAHVNWLLLVYLIVVLVGWFRMFEDHGMLYKETTASMISEYLINTIKWVFPGLLLFDGCRSRERFRWALGSIIAMYVALAIQVIKWMPPSYALNGEEMAERSLKILMNEIGIHRVTMSMMLAGAGWAVFSLRLIAKTSKQRMWTILGFVVLLYAQALTAGRAGYLTWIIVGLILCFVKWPKYLVFVPVFALVIAVAVPGVVDRLAEGLNSATQQIDPTGGLAATGHNADNAEYTVTAGRTIAWKYVIPKIGQAPWFGYGRQAMKRTGISDFLFNTWQESFPHPHNAYLEMLLDNGWVGLILVLPFYFLVLKNSFVLLKDSTDPVCAVSGAVCCSLVLALMVAGLSSQSFYPNEPAVPIWCAIGLMFRVWVERKKAIRDGNVVAVFSDQPVQVAPVLKKHSVTLWLDDVAEGNEAINSEQEPKEEEVEDLWRP